MIVKSVGMMTEMQVFTFLQGAVLLARASVFAF